jgi:hypothetical protein
VRRQINDPAEALQAIQDFSRRRAGVDRVNSEQMEDHWERLGQRGDPPLAYEDSFGVLCVNVEVVGEPPARGRERQPTEEASAEPLGIRTAIDTPEAARWLRDEWARRGLGDVSQVLSRDPSFLQEEWESAGGRGPHPLAWVDTRNRLVTDARRLGTVPHEVEIERMIIREGVQAEINSAQTAREILEDSMDRGTRDCVWGCPNTETMQRVWQEAGEEGEPPIAFVTSEDSLVVNMEALGRRLEYWWFMPE